MYKYEKIVEEIKKDIKNGRYQKGLPSERDLAKQFETSRGTIRKVIDLLKEESVVNSARGSGTYLNRRPINQELNSVYSLSEDMNRMNRSLTTEILDYKLIHINKEVAIKMGVEEGELVYYIKRLRYIDEDPCILEENYLLAKIYNGIEIEKLVNSSLYAYLEEKYNNSFSESYEEFSAIVADEKIKKLFNLKKESAVIQIDRTSYVKDTISEFTRGIVKGDKFKYIVKLK